MKTILLLLLCLFQLPFLCSQASDCVDAVQIVDKSPIETLITWDLDEIRDELFGDGCPDIQFPPFPPEDQLPTYWMKWSVFEGGNLTINISTDTTLNDIDFIVYKADESDPSCNTLTPIRCLFSGYNVTPNGMAILDESCFPTGLSIDETDLSEGPGCGPVNNGYAKFLEVEKDETYYMVVINFFNQEEELVKVDFCGTALLGPNDTFCNPSTSTHELEHEEASVLLAPNPVGDYLRIHNLPEGENVFKNWNIVDMYGGIHRISSMSETEFVADVRFLSSGIYILIYEEKGEIKSIKFIKS